MSHPNVCLKNVSSKNRYILSQTWFRKVLNLSVQDRSASGGRQQQQRTFCHQLFSPPLIRFQVVFRHKFHKRFEMLSFYGNKYSTTATTDSIFPIDYEPRKQYFFVTNIRCKPSFTDTYTVISEFSLYTRSWNR